MTSLATPTSEAPGERREARSRPIAGLRADVLFGLAVAAGLLVAAFVTSGGVALAPNTWTEIALLVVGAAVAVGVLLVGAPGPRHGLAALGLFALLAALTAGSVLWSVEPQSSWIEAGRTLSYFAVFGAGLGLARIVPERWPGLVGAVAAATTALAGYALLTKVFPATFDPTDTFGRLRAPFDYFNATGLIGALGLPACLWAGSRRERGRATRGLAAPAIAVLATAMVLSQSRGALLAGGIGLIVWFAFAPLRLRGALVLVLGLLGAAVLSLYAIHTHPLTHDGVSLSARTDAGHGFGLVVLLVLIAVAAAGVLAGFTLDRLTVGPERRRELGMALLLVVALIPVGAVGALAASQRGFTGEISHLISTVTNTNSGAPNTPGRLVQLGNARGRYWSEGIKVGEHNVLHGSGAFGYATAVKRYTTDANTVPTAHSFVVQTFADFGLLGIAVALGLLIAWALAVRRTLRASDSADHDGERAGLLTLLCVVVVFGVHSAIDWTWFIPGTALPALLCAGWLAGRGPIATPVGRGAQPRRLVASPGIGAVTLSLAALVLLCGWEIWQPLRSADAQSSAVAALEQGRTGAAITDARTAADVDPVAIEPLLQLSAIYNGLGDRGAARAELVRAARRQPENPSTWLALGEFDLGARRPGLAVASLQRAYSLAPGSSEALDRLLRARKLAGG